MLVASWAALVMVCLLVPASSQAGCITSLPMNYAFSSLYAAAYSRTLPVTLSTRGPAIRNVEAKLYTFGGDLLASGRLKGTLRSSKKLNMRLRFAMQPGKYTLTLFGEPNASRSCGLKHRFPLVRFLDCPARLPVTFPQKPRGKAADYGGIMTVRLASKGPLLRNVNVSMSRFDGTELGSRSFDSIFGSVAANFGFSGGVQPGGYTVFVSGRLARQPRGCGDASATTTIKLT